MEVEVTNSKMASNIVGNFQKLNPRTKLIYLSSVAISIGLLVFGICIWALDEVYGATSNLESSFLGDSYGDRDGVDIIAPLSPTNAPSLKTAEDEEYNKESFQRLPTFFPSFAPKQSKSAEPSQSGLRATLKPTISTQQLFDHSEEPSHGHTEHPSNNPSKRPSPKPSLSPSSFSPSKVPSMSPLRRPSMSPSSNYPTSIPTLSPNWFSPSLSPTSSSSPTATTSPTNEPLFKTHEEPPNPNLTYFNYNTRWDSKFGPNSWENVTVLNSTDNYWYEFGYVDNMCGMGTQSPIDLCRSPSKQCKEIHEFRTKRGDYAIAGNLTVKQVLSNKLRVVMLRRIGDEPDPPHVDFSGLGYGDMDMLNIDIKFPSEHTLCGRTFDGEMQYFFYHPGHEKLVAITWLLVAQENATNNHMQLLIDEFQAVYDGNEDICVQNNTLQNETDGRPTGYGRLFRNRRRPWDPFHADIQKTVHFWGYSGSLTEPPCTSSVYWRIMDVPVPISYEQLHQMQNILFNNKDSDTCEFTSNHFKGSVARPIADSLQYYKCTRSNYVSDGERDLCGDEGCDLPYGKDLERYYEPIIFVTGPPSEPPTLSPST